jgi:hypothetical protein
LNNSTAEILTYWDPDDHGTTWRRNPASSIASHVIVLPDPASSSKQREQEGRPFYAQSLSRFGKLYPRKQVERTAWHLGGAAPV